MIHTIEKTRSAIQTHGRWIAIGLLIAIIFIGLLVDSSIVLAQDEEDMEGVQQLQGVLEKIRNWIMALAGTFAIVMFTIAGVRYLMSSDVSGTEKAKSALLAGAIGLVIVLLAPTIVAIIEYLAEIEDE